MKIAFIVFALATSAFAQDISELEHRISVLEREQIDGRGAPAPDQHAIDEGETVRTEKMIEYMKFLDRQRELRERNK
jgi:hypothetical protein